MSEPHQQAWLYTRGSESIRLVRKEDATACRLFLFGPGRERVSHEFADLTQCMHRQAEIERNLLAAGYQLSQPQATERRGKNSTWSGADHPAAS